ncbi:MULTISPECIES: PTS transporter subunit EIIC [Erysipelothrix]|uniref:PTS transporter subunit EIIC n=1 Tax=Erysipelothrix TaxID=1647 RepID=UPI0013774C77|nr:MULTISPECIES: PTS transporter subunit EIIC [unclassified Erysipelothrix]MBK2402473.1 PTS sugar transporter subunit IIC [Erysipelothrix sp. strain 2 (EsS2-6-Brazil)]MBK2403361.1 PTS sugar transporter subunit IIC [Erysipelothrix sp. strain 2 (EsS2-7-Brazil)]NBA00671.1 PTS transporter subunit EIIC [Erysipelothrix rhusiopathiae]
MFLEKFVTLVQGSRSLNAVKNAINKMAYINIILGVCIFIFYQFDQIGGITDSIRTQAVLFYQLYCIMLAVSLAYLIASETLNADIDVSFRMSAVFLSLLPGIVLVPKGYVTAFPIVTMIVVVVISYFINRLDQFKVKGKHVPQAVTDYYNRLWPTFVLMLCLFIFIFVFNHFFLGLANVIISITNVLSGFIVMLSLIMIICMFWILGIHGVGVIGTLMRPFWFHMMLVNGFMIVSGDLPVYIGTEAFLGWCVWIGGSGCTLGLTVNLIFAKSRHLKQLGSDSVVSNIFNINENIIFGTPIVENQYFRIPFFVAPIITGSVAYWSMKLGFVTIPSIVAPWVIPMPLGLFISTLGDVRSLVLSLLLIVITTAVYFPFFRKYDQSLVKQEQDN